MSSVKWRPFCLGLNVLKMEQRAKQPRARGMMLIFLHVKYLYFIIGTEGKWICCQVCMRSYAMSNIYILEMDK